MSNIEARNECIGKITDIAESIGTVGALFVTGDDSTVSNDIRMLAIPKSDEQYSQMYAKLNYLLNSELEPLSAQITERSNERTVKQLELSDELVLKMVFANQSVAEPEQWWRVIFDNIGASAAFGGVKTDEDILCDMAEPMAEPEPVAEPETELEPEPIAEPEPVEQPAEADEDSGDEYWDFVAKQMVTAKRAIASESFIRAGECINLLRHMLIELICVRNGVEENFDHAIDFVECEEKNMLAKTYAAPNKASMAAALSVISELFDRLA